MTFVTVRRTCTQVRTMRFQICPLAAYTDYKERHCSFCILCKGAEQPFTIPGQHVLPVLLHRKSHCFARSSAAYHYLRGTQAALK